MEGQMNARPLSVTVMGWLYIVVGIAALVSHLHDLKGNGLFRLDAVEMVLVEAAAIVAGIFLLRGMNWARWLAAVWVVGHVVLSLFFAFPQLAFHCVIAAAIIYLLFRKDAARYFEAKAIG